MISALTTPPNRGQSPDIFNAAADAFMAGLPQFVTELNAMGTLFNLATTTTSSTSNSVATGSKTFTVPAGLGFTLGMPLIMASTASPLNNMYGVVTAYSSTTLTVQVSAINGTGTFTAWSISLAAASIGAGLGTNTFSGVQNWNQGTDIASASTVNLTSATGNTINITGTTNITAFTLGNGMMRNVIFAGACLLTHNVSTCQLNAGGANYTTSAGDRAVIFGANGAVYVNIIRYDGLPVIAPTVSSKIETIGASVASNALTLTLNPTALDFRSSSLSLGSVNTRVISSAISLTISSGSTLGTVNGVQSRIAVLAIDVTGTVELAAVNIVGGVDLSETGLISTTAEGGAGGADSASVIYSAIARSNVPYRLVGYVESTQATAGTWATLPSTIQGIGGNVFSAMSSIGYGQTWQNVTGSRSSGVTYYNTSGKPIMISVTVTDSRSNQEGYASVTIGGVAIGYIGGHTYTGICIPTTGSFIVPNGMSYSCTIVESPYDVIVQWSELR